MIKGFGRLLERVKSKHLTFSGHSRLFTNYYTVWYQVLIVSVVYFHEKFNCDACFECSYDARLNGLFGGRPCTHDHHPCMQLIN